MRIPLIISTLGALLLSAAPASAAELAPNWSLESAEGEMVRLSEEVRRQPVIVLFWATWCPYCKALMPHLQSIRTEYGDQIEVLAVNFREEGDPVGVIREAGYDFTVLPDGDDVAAAYGIWGTPGVIVVDGNREIRFDLRTLPKKDPPAAGKPPSHRQKAAYRAPYWAAEIRKAVDEVLAERAQ